jgi:hypothetical protein
MSVEAELTHITEINDGILRPYDVVDYAKNPTTTLHTKFTWDDAKAAYEYRLEEARRLIRVYVTTIETVSKPIRVWVSLKSDRVKEKGGYRLTDDVMRDDEMRKQFLREALEDLKYWRAKYRSIKEFDAIFDAIDEVASTIGD